MIKKIIVALSGGVDSAVCAYLLTQQKYDVTGVFVQNWDVFLNQEKNNQTPICQAQIDYQSVLTIGKKLQIPIYKVNFIQQYWQKVFLPFLQAYQNGNTPNPDVLCNKYIKFGLFYDYCFKHFVCDFIATGHYANIVADWRLKLYYLQEAFDLTKDQTYFLNQLNQHQLSKVIFPLAHYSKKQVRQIAYKAGLSVWNKKDSTGICFIGKRNLTTFLQNYLPNNPGDVVDIVSQQKIGTHNGLHFYTIGQRKGLHLHYLPQAYYVVKKDKDANILYVASIKQASRYLKQSKIRCYPFHWICQKPQPNALVEVRFRHLQTKMLAICTYEKDLVCFYSQINFQNVAPGQYLVVYQQNWCLGGGVII